MVSKWKNFGLLIGAYVGTTLNKTDHSRNLDDNQNTLPSDEQNSQNPTQPNVRILTRNFFKYTLHMLNTFINTLAPYLFICSHSFLRFEVAFVNVVGMTNRDLVAPHERKGEI